MEIMETLITALVGMAVVFAVLILLMLFISVMTKLVKGGKKAKVSGANAVQAPAQSQAPAQAPATAKGSCGDVMLFDVPDKIAAQLMAITAEKLGAPLNTLRFVSIKEVK